MYCVFISFDKSQKAVVLTLVLQPFIRLLFIYSRFHNRAILQNYYKPRNDSRRKATMQKRGQAPPRLAAIHPFIPATDITSAFPPHTGNFTSLSLGILFPFIEAVNGLGRSAVALTERKQATSQRKK